MFVLFGVSRESSSPMSSSMRVTREVDLPTAPALLGNNLVTHGNGDSMSYATPTSVITLNIASGTPLWNPVTFPSGVYVEGIAGMTDHANASLLVIALLSNRTAMVILNGQVTHSISAKGPTETFTCAAAVAAAARSSSLSSTAIVVALGGSEGSVDVLHLSASGQPVASTDGEVSVPVQAHERRSISAIDVDGSSDATVSGDAAGHIVFWQGGTPVACVAPADTTDAVTSGRYLPPSDQVAVAYGGGRINVLQRHTGGFEIVLQAHSRWICAMTYNSASQMLASASEDGQVYVWGVHNTEPNSVCVAHGAVQNELPTGVAILGTQRIVALLSYDVPKLRLMCF